MKRCVIQIYILAVWYHKRGCVLWGLSRQCVFLCTLVSLAGIKLANFSPSRQKKVSIKCPGLRESSFLNKAEQLGYLKTLLPCLYKKCLKTDVMFSIWPWLKSTVTLQLWRSNAFRLKLFPELAKNQVHQIKKEIPPKKFESFVFKKLLKYFSLFKPKGFKI